MDLEQDKIDSSNSNNSSNSNDSSSSNDSQNKIDKPVEPYKIEIDVSNLVSKSKSAFGFAKNLFGSTIKISSNISSNIVTAVGDRYEKQVPENIKNKITDLNNSAKNNTQMLVHNISNTSLEIFDKNIKPVLYNTTLKISDKISKTCEMTKYMLEDIPENSHILHIGIGTAQTYFENADTIKSRNLKIVGLDADMGYILKARHGLIDYDLEEHFTFYCIDKITNNGKIQVESDRDILNKIEKKYDYVIITEYYSTIQNVTNLLIYAERYLNDMGYMIVGSILFDDYRYSIDVIKQNMKYISGIDLGKLMLKSELNDYIVNERLSTDYEFRTVTHNVIGSFEFKSYVVRWRPCDK